MRKWMSERLKRRKKTGEGSTSAKEATKAPEPLQPRFYDNEPTAPPAAAAEVPVVESRRLSRPAPVPESTSEPVSATGAASATEPRPRTTRRRRSRGGRGGNRRRLAAAVPAVAPEAAAAEASATEQVPGGQRAVEAAPAQAISGQANSGQAIPGQTMPARTMPDQVVATQAASAGAAAAPARASKGTVVLAIGLPGSGKSSWFKRHNIHPLSSDLLRELLFDDAQEQRFQDLVFSNLRSMLKARLIARRPMNYVDATNLTPHDRHSWIKLAKDYGYDVQGVFFDVPLEVCMERHQRRGRAVPEDIMRKMAGKLKAPTFEEGFSKITVVRVKQKEAAAR
ncbi:MAG: AAA family ATPase [Terriglobales bacterium]